MWKVQLFELNYDEREETAVSSVIRSGWITMGDQTRLFEERFAQYLGNGVSCTAVSSGTAALHLALLALGVGPGDEVILPALTFVADLNVVALVGARPVLADSSSLEDWNLDPGRVEELITPRTKAVMVMHYAGYPCRMEPILECTRSRGIALVEDAAHAPGARWEGKRCGTLGDIGCFSFFTNKNLSVGEGGMVAVRSEELHERFRHLRSHGMTSLTLDRHRGRAISYDVVRPGLNYRIDEMRAALGVVQLEKLEEANRRRRELTRAYRDRLEGLVSIPFPRTPEADSACHILPVLLPEEVDRRKVIESMREEGIQTSIHYPSFQEFTAFRETGLASTPVASRIAGRELTLPLYPTMSPQQVDLVVASLQKAL